MSSSFRSSLISGILFASIACLGGSRPAFAKRAAPAEVPAVQVGNVEYRVGHFPLEHMGFVEAHNIKSNRTLWERQVYVVVKNPDLEGDVQDVFITKLERDGDSALVITNEAGSVYRLDLQTLEVKVEKGAIRQGRH